MTDSKAKSTQDLEANCVQILACQFQFSNTTGSNNNTGSTPLTRTLLEVDNSVAGVGDDSGAVASPNSSEFSFSPSTTPEKEMKRPADIKVVGLQEEEEEEASSPVSISSSSRACLIPTADDPVDNSFVMCLDSSRDIGRINPVHIVVRRHIFEVRRTAKTGRIFFQCACCKHRPRADRAKLSTLAPQAVKSIYRAFVRFMMEHVSACRDIPSDIRSLDARARKIANAPTTHGRGYRRDLGIKNYWAMSAKKMGLQDGSDGKSIVYRDQF